MLVLVALLLGYVGIVKHFEIPHVLVLDFRDGSRPLCLPFLTTEDSRSDTTSANTADWKNRGPDGQGGHLLSFDIVREGEITDISVQTCHGCGGWFWLCPDPRCSGRQTFETINSSTRRAWAATNGGPNVTAIFQVKYTIKQQFCLGN